MGEPRRAGGGVEQVGLAAPDPGVDVERVELGRFARRRLGHRARRGEGEAVGGALAKRFERVTRLHRRAAERALRLRRPARLLRGRRAPPVPARAAASTFSARSGPLIRTVPRTRSSMRTIALVLALPQFQQPVAVVRVDPRLEEPRRHRQIDEAGVGFLELDAGKPTVEDVFPELGAQTLLHTQPLIRVRPGCRHGTTLLDLDVVGRRPSVRVGPRRSAGQVAGNENVTSVVG